MKKSLVIPRRTFLKGVGTTIALPLLEAMIPSIALAETAGPKRFAFIYAPLGTDMGGWNPTGVTSETNFTLGSSMAGLTPYKNDLLVIRGLDNYYGGVDGAGDHARACSTIMTGVRINKSSSEISAGISADQVIANAIGNSTAIKSLSVCTNSNGGSDSGYAAVYNNSVSWISATIANPNVVGPRLIFDRLFPNGTSPTPTPVPSAEDKARLYKRSILDFVLDDAARLKNRLGTTDKLKVDEHMQAVRDIESRIVAATPTPIPQATCPQMARPAGTPAAHQDHVRLVYDLLALAFQCDLTRVATFMLTTEGGGHPSYSFINVAEDHHALTHNNLDLSGQTNQSIANADVKLRTIDKWRLDQFAYFISKLKAATEAGGNVLDNSMIVYGSPQHVYSAKDYISGAYAHYDNDLPFLIAGKGGGSITPGRFLQLSGTVPVCNLWLTLMQSMGVNATSHGDSTGLVPRIKI